MFSGLSFPLKMLGAACLPASTSGIVRVPPCFAIPIIKSVTMSDVVRPAVASCPCMTLLTLLQRMRNIPVSPFWNHLGSTVPGISFWKFLSTLTGLLIIRRT